MVQNYTAIDDFIAEKKAVSSPHKESEPVGKSLQLDRGEVSRIVEMQGQDESSQQYISEKKEDIEIPDELKKIGLKPVNVEQFSSFENIKLPISDDKVLTGAHAPITSSLRWLATLGLYLLARAHLTLRIVHGHVVRVFKR